MALARAAVVAAFALTSCRPASFGRSNGAGCPPGAAPGATGCTCRADLRLVLGACVSPRTAADHCGVTATATAFGCRPLPSCGAGRARDLASGACLPRREVRALATSLGILVADDEVLGCPAGGELAAAEDPTRGDARLACLAGNAEPPTPARRCPAGSLAEGSACAPVTDGSRVDVVRWLHDVIGPEGGEGTPLLCEALARSAGALGEPALEQRVTVALSIPDNDVSLVAGTASATTNAGRATVELDRLLRPMLEALRSLGGTASQAAVSATVRCRGSSAALRPVAVPENDHEK